MTRVASCPTAAASLPHLGPRLRRLRRLRGLKQGVLAEWAGVTQATVSRWERGELALRPELAGALLARLTGGASRLREREWGRTAAGLIGCSLWLYATEGIRVAEADLHPLGWWRSAAPAPARSVPGAATRGCGWRPG